MQRGAQAKSTPIGYFVSNGKWTGYARRGIKKYPRLGALRGCGAPAGLVDLHLLAWMDLRTGEVGRTRLISRAMVTAYCETHVTRGAWLRGRPAHRRRSGANSITGVALGCYAVSPTAALLSQYLSVLWWPLFCVPQIVGRLHPDPEPSSPSGLDGDRR